MPGKRLEDVGYGGADRPHFVQGGRVNSHYESATSATAFVRRIAFFSDVALELRDEVVRVPRNVELPLFELFFEKLGEEASSRYGRL